VRAALFVSLVVFSAGCKQGASSLQVTVGSDGVVHGVDHLHVVASNGGMTAQPLDFPLTGAPVDIPPNQTFTLVFAADRQGVLSLVVDADDASGTSLATASAMAMITPGKLSTAIVTLPGQVAGPPMYTVTGFPSGLGGGVSSGGGLTLEGAIGLPGPRVASTSGALSVEPLIPRSNP
jgi:hypothetical protein